MQLLISFINRLVEPELRLPVFPSNSESDNVAKVDYESSAKRFIWVVFLN